MNSRNSIPKSKLNDSVRNMINDTKTLSKKLSTWEHLKGFETSPRNQSVGLCCKSIDWFLCHQLTQGEFYKTNLRIKSLGTSKDRIK